MKPIKNPPPPEIGPDSTDTDIVNLQDALLLLIAKERIRFPDGERRIPDEQ